MNACTDNGGNGEKGIAAVRGVPQSFGRGFPHECYCRRPERHVPTAGGNSRKADHDDGQAGVPDCHRLVPGRERNDGWIARERSTHG